MLVGEAVCVGVPVRLELGVPVWLELGVPVWLELGVPVALELAEPVMLELVVPVVLELPVLVKLELTVTPSVAIAKRARLSVRDKVLFCTPNADATERHVKTARQRHSGDTMRCRWAGTPKIAALRLPAKVQ